MKARVVESDDVNYELMVGQFIDVDGFVFDGPLLHAVWHDADGYIWTVPATAIRMVTPASEGLDRLRKHLGPATYVGRPQMTNAIGGPQTNRGVR